MTVHYRSFVPELEVRSGGDGRTVSGIAVPFNRPQRIDSTLTEQFARGAFNHQIEVARRANNSYRVHFARDHVSLGGTPIGKTVLLKDDAAGLYGEWRVSKTVAGDETLELIRDGVYEQLSIGFRERPNGNRRLPGGIIERTKADLREVSIVLEGAYGEGALVSAVRSADEDEDENTCSCGGAKPRLEIGQSILAAIPKLPDVS